MIVRLIMQGLRHGKARFACAAAGIAVSVAAVVFTTSLTATNSAQVPLIAAQAAAPWKSWTAMQQSSRRPGERRHGSGELARRKDFSLRTVALTIDYRPGGHVMQGPPMRAILAKSPVENPYGAVSLAEGRWVDESSGEREVVCVRKAMQRFGAAAPALGEELKFVGREGTMTAKIVGYLDGPLKLPPQFPNVFASRSAFDALAAEEHGEVSFFLDDSSGETTPESESVVNFYKGDDQRRMDYAKPLMIAAAILTALSLLVNSLLLSVESNRMTLATLRMVGLTRAGVVGFVAVEALVAGFVGWLVGAIAALLSLFGYVAADAATFPAGVAFDFGKLVLTLGILPIVIIAAVLFALRPALKVRPMDSLATTPRSRRNGMVITFALGFAAFAAVEVWGASLMRAFVPSPEWPDAIVSILPGGVSSFDIEKLRGIDGVKRISELLPLQVFTTREDANPGPHRGAPNALFLAAEWLPDFKFLEGDHDSAVAGMAAGGVVITEMMSRAYGLHVGDNFTALQAARHQGNGDASSHGAGELARRTFSFPVVGIIDLNWHMVTSRGLVRGMNRMPVMTDGPVFASFDTVESIDPRPAAIVKMTHLWVEYEPGFAEKCGGVFAAGRKVEAEIARLLGNPVTATIRLHARDEIADGTLAHGSDLIGAAARVPFIFLFILSIGFVAMLVAEADARRREFAVLRAVGATRGQLVWRLAQAALKTSILGVVIAIPIGALVGWLFSIQTAAVWPGMPHWFVVPWRIILEGAFGALVFALAFALPTSMRLIRNPRP